MAGFPLKADSHARRMNGALQNTTYRHGILDGIQLENGIDAHRNIGRCFIPIGGIDATNPVIHTGIVILENCLSDELWSGIPQNFLIGKINGTIGKNGS